MIATDSYTSKTSQVLYSPYLQLEAEHLRKVFIGGLNPSTDDETMRSYFSQYGEILDCIVMKDAATKR